MWQENPEGEKDYDSKGEGEEEEGWKRDGDLRRQRISTQYKSKL